MKGTVKWVIGSLVLLGLAVLLAGQAQPPKDPLIEWAYPKAKRGKKGTNQPPLAWTTFTTNDEFEKVWEFYRRKTTASFPGMGGSEPPKQPSLRSGTLYMRGPFGTKICAQLYDISPARKLGVFVLREEARTVSITIVQGAKEKQVFIMVAVDQR